MTDLSLRCDSGICAGKGQQWAGIPVWYAGIVFQNTVVEQRSKYGDERWQQGLSFDVSEVNMSCEILSSAVTDHIFSFFFSEPITLLAF